MREIADDESLMALCSELSAKEVAIVQRRAAFYADLAPESVHHYVSSGSPEVLASHIVGLLTDLPARWLFDCATNRPGLLKDDVGGAGASLSET